VLDEIRWGNLWIHGMFGPAGQVYEDVGGGDIKAGFDYEDGWWLENHSGCIANNAGCIFTDNAIGSGDERRVRTTYNPWCQYAFVRVEAMASTVLPGAEAANCLALAQRAWQYARKCGHDQRTLFLGAELHAALELRQAGSRLVSPQEISALAQALQGRQDPGGAGLSHYFLEKDQADGFRSVGFPCDPPLALLRFCELAAGGPAEVNRAREAVEHYIDNFLLADAPSNPFGVPPYGIYLGPSQSPGSVFRDAGRGRGVRTFIHPFNRQDMVHGSNAGQMHQAHLLARAGRLFGRGDWQAAAERLLQWATGHNPVGLSLFTGVGYRHPVAFSICNGQIPEAAVNGFVGRPDDTPYLETSNVVDWSTQEIWGLPYCHAVGAIVSLE
jgi:hypothetical protein